MVWGEINNKLDLQHAKVSIAPDNNRQFLIPRTFVSASRLRCRHRGIDTDNDSSIRTIIVGGNNNNGNVFVHQDAQQ